MITVSHGAKRYDIEYCVQTPMTTEFLSMRLEQLTKVPVSQQKIIFRGKQLPIGEGLLSEYKIKPGSRLMLLGKVLDPDNEKALNSIRKAKNDADLILEKVKNINSEISGIKDGHLPEEHHKEALTKLHRQCIGAVEELMKLLEHLDGMKVLEENSKTLKKSVIIDIQQCLDHCDKVMERL